MSGWKRAVPAILVLLIASMPIVYYQVGNLVYTQAAATNLECSGHSARNSPDEFSVELWNEDIAEGLFEKNETLAGDLEHLWLIHGITLPLMFPMKRSRSRPGLWNQTNPALGSF